MEKNGLDINSEESKHNSSLTQNCKGQAREILLAEGRPGLLQYFFVSVKAGNLDDVKNCFNCGVNTNERQLGGETALHEAAERGNIYMGALLISRPDINVNLRSLSGSTPLHTACMFGKSEFVTFLLQNHADPNMVMPNINATPLHIATNYANYEIVNSLLRHNANPNKLNAFCETPLMNCVLKNPYFQIAKLLVADYGADPNVYCTGGMSVFLDLCLSCNSEEQLQFIQLLIDSGVDINTSHQFTKKNALHFAAMIGYTPSIMLLLMSGVEMNAVDIWNRTPKDVAIQHGNLEIAYLFDFFQVNESFVNFED